MRRTCLFHVSGNRYPPFPAQHHTRRIWEELSKDFDEYHVIARGLSNRYSHTIDGNIHLHLLPSLGSRMWPFFFLSWLLPIFSCRYKPTHLIAQCPVIGGMSAATCSLIFRVPLFLELHGAHYFYRTKAGFKGLLEHSFYKCFSIPAMRVACRIRSLSEDMSEHILAVYGRRAYKASFIVPNRVDLEVFRPFKREYRCEGPLKVISVGSFSSTKNHCALIEDLCNTGIDLRLTLVGGGPLRSEYEALADRLRLRGCVEIVDSVSHTKLAKLLADHDVYVHYSVTEALSRAILEAMAVALPIVATRVGFIKGILVDQENSIIIDRPYAEGLNAALAGLADSQELRRKLGTAARRDIEERFEWNRTFDLYRSAILTMI